MIKRTLYFGNPAYLSLNNRNILIRLPADKKRGIVDEKRDASVTRTAVIEDVGFVILDNQQITITQGLINALLENNTAILTCNNSHLPSGLLLPLAGNTIQTERYRSQIYSSLPLKKQLWQQTVKAKIANQAATLRKFTDAETGNMQAWEKDVRSGDTFNLEARAAAYYWKNIFPEIKGFLRDPDGDYPNVLLNYGYAIVRAVIARALVCSGLLPTLGIHHSNRYNAYCLADDIMEPYRPYVDIKVLEFLKANPDVDGLSEIAKRELLSLPVSDVHISGSRRPLMIAAQQTANSLRKCFDGESKTIDYPTLA